MDEVKKPVNRKKTRLDREFPVKLTEKERESSETARFGKYDPATAKMVVTKHRESLKKAKADAVEKVWSIDGDPSNRYEVMQYLVSMVSEGVRLPQLCDADGMPPLIEVRRWFKRHPDFKAALDEAKEAMAERYVDHAMNILQEAEPDRTGLAKAESELAMKMAGMMSEEFKEKKIIQTEDISHTWTEAQILARMRVLTDSDPALKEEFKKLISSNIIDAEICDEQGSEGDGHDAVNQLEDRGVEQNG